MFLVWNIWYFDSISRSRIRCFSYLYVRRFGLWLSILAVLVALSRVALGRHYVSDAFIGLLIGVAEGLVVFCLFGPVLRSLLELFV